MKLRKFISDQDKQAIEKAVGAAEANTSGEIVPAIVESSSGYEWVTYRAALLGWAAASLATVVMHYLHPFALEFWHIYAAQAVGLFLGWMLSRCAWTLRLLVPPSVMEQEVLEAAQGAFLRFGLTNTRDRTGVLIFVSLKEHRVQILGDKGIHEKVGTDFWKAETDRIVTAIREGRAAQGIIAAIGDIGQKLQMHFPRKSDDTNELPDRVRS